MNTEMWRRVIRATLAEIGSEATYDDYLGTARKMYGAEMKSCMESYQRQGAIKSLKSAMRMVSNIDEEDEDAPCVNFDMLPGPGAPEFIHVGTMREPKLLAFADVKVADFDKAIKLRKHVYSRAGARIEDLQQKREWLAAHILDQEETVGHCVARLLGIHEVQPNIGVDAPTTDRHP